MLISGEVGFGKPDERIFNLILARRCITAEPAIMVGNSLSSDIQRAKAVGMRTVWLARGGNTRDEWVRPEAEVVRLTRRRDVAWKTAATALPSDLKPPVRPC